jgi:hypothetical protein
MEPCKVRRAFVASLLFSAGQTAWAAVPASPIIDFQRQVRPILSDNCFLCHGPDKGTRMADMRLDVKEEAMAARKNGSVIVPGKPDESLLVKRIFSENPGYRMPPTFSHKTLSAEQKETLRKWIEQGASWKEHWSFIPPARPALPEVKDAAWPKTAIDRFVLARLETAGLTPNPEADRHALIRRVTLDLTGLPPTPEDVAAFVKDPAPKAYENLVDRLLASPRYGEHRARYWLDAARYADSQGLHIDNYREMWPYREWVIGAFNGSMPFDRFTVEQLAGDLLPNATLEQKIASGFHRCNVTTNEGGSIPAEVEAMYAKDRADTTGIVWLGLTVGCATCHDHKFDPIKQKEYYALTSFFRNTTQLALDGNVPDTPPTVVVPRQEDWKRWTDLAAERASLREAIAKEQSANGAKFEKWLANPRGEPASFPTQSVIEAVNVKILSETTGGHAQTISLPADLPKGVSLGDGPLTFGAALHFEKEASLDRPGVAVDIDKPFTIATWVYVPKEKGGFTIASQLDPKMEGKRHGWSLSLNGGELGVSGRAPEFHMNATERNYISARPAADYELKPEAWYHLQFTYDGSRNRKGLSLFINGVFVPTYGTGEDNNPLADSVLSTAKLKLGGSSIARFKLLSIHEDEVQAELLYAAEKAAAGDREASRQLFTYEVDPVARKTVARLRQVDAERTAIARRGAVTFVMQERTDTEPVAHVLNRGQYDQMRDEVHPGVMAALPPMAQSLPRNRLGLAKWIVDPANPMTARVTVNRFWQELFGTGIVKTAEDFGAQGDSPSHPELLDWLALEFRDSGWDVKKLFRLMVTSEAYRQSASSNSDKLAKDPDNRLLSRGPRFRMDAEMVRDCALSASGLLRSEIGGPSVKPYQPINIWETVAMDQSNTRFYKQDSGGKLYRRSMYTFWKRSAPPPSMDIFNAPSRETCIVRRERTNTPLQALATMNDPQFVEAARRLAQNALKQSRANVDGQVNFMADRLLSRDLEPKEMSIVLGSYRDYLSYYDGKPDDAAKLLNVGESKADANLPKPQFAAMTMVANELMNLDEVLVK